MFHRHAWGPRSVTQDRYGGWNSDGATRVLYACTGCGKTKTKKMHGLWRIEDLTTVNDNNLNELLKNKERSDNH